MFRHKQNPLDMPTNIYTLVPVCMCVWTGGRKRTLFLWATPPPPPPLPPPSDSSMPDLTHICWLVFSVEHKVWLSCSSLGRKCLGMQIHMFNNNRLMNIIRFQSLAGQNVMRWLVTFVIGVCTGLVSCNCASCCHEWPICYPWHVLILFS